MKYHGLNNYCKIIILASLLSCISIENNAKTVSGKIEKVWVEYNAYEDGEKGMQIHVKFSVVGMLNKQGTVNVWFYFADGTRLKDNNGRYKTKTGYVSAYKNYKPNYENTIYNDFKIFMPYNELHLTNGNHDMKFLTGIFDNNDNQIATSEYHSFYININNNDNNSLNNNAVRVAENNDSEEKKSEEKFGDKYSDEGDIYKRMVALKKQYPEGMKWTNKNYYRWKGGIYTIGYGCIGFAFILSDAAFGNLPAREHRDLNNIRVGDILRMDNNTHSVIVLGIDNTSITLAEGNYNSSIHWGRKVSIREARNTINYILTRYPE